MTQFIDLLSDWGKQFFYIMHLSYRLTNKIENEIVNERLWYYATRNGVIGLDYTDYVPVNWNHLSESRKQRFRSDHPVWVTQYNTFCYDMEVDDVVLVLAGQNRLLGLAQVIEPGHRYDKNLSDNRTFFDHYRKVYWIRAYNYSNPQPIDPPVKGFDNTLIQVTMDSLRWPLLTQLHL